MASSRRADFLPILPGRLHQLLFPLPALRRAQLHVRFCGSVFFFSGTNEPGTKRASIHIERISLSIRQAAVCGGERRCVATLPARLSATPGLKLALARLPRPPPTRPPRASAATFGLRSSLVGAETRPRFGTGRCPLDLWSRRASSDEWSHRQLTSSFEWGGCATLGRVRPAQFGEGCCVTLHRRSAAPAPLLRV